MFTPKTDILVLSLKLLIFQGFVQLSGSSLFGAEYGIDLSNNFDKAEPSPDWESLVFWIPNGISLFGQMCRLHSQFYCLDSYMTQRPNGTVLTNGVQTLDEAACVAWFRVLIREHFFRINMIDFHAETGCCDLQVKKYVTNGLRNRNIPPDQYLEILTNYRDENKTLNYIAAIYAANLCLNMLLDIGFGPGELRRDHHRTVVEGAPYVIVGREFDDLGVQLMDSKTFNYWNITQELTFHWFKHNMMCKGNPWICEEENGNQLSLSKSQKHVENGSNQEKKAKKSHRGKKGRRKKQSGPSSKNELKRRR